MTKVARAPRTRISASPNSAKRRTIMEPLKVLAVDLGRKSIHQRLHRRELRVNLQGLPIGLQGMRLVLGRHEDVPEAGPGAEMMRLELEHPSDIRHRADRIVGQIESVGAAVPRFGPIGLERDDPIEK